MKNALLFSLLILVTGCAPSSNPPPVTSEETLTEIRIQKEIAVRDRMDQLRRLYRVGMPILAANAPLCGAKIWPHTGMMVESLSAVPDKFKDAMSIYYGVQNQLTAAYIAPGSPAEGKILPGDLIVKVNGEDIPSGGRGKEAFYEAIWNEDRDITLPIRMTVERGRKAQRQDVVIQPTPACASLIIMEEKDEVDAYATGYAITFSAGMMREADDDDMVAAIFGHELAHNARNHGDMREMNTALGAVTSIIIEYTTGLDFENILTEIGAKAYSQERETESDYIGLYMMARAGYDPQKGMEFARFLGALHPDSIHATGGTHPPTARRFVMMTKTVAEIAAKKKNGQPLMPSEKSALSSP